MDEEELFSEYLQTFCVDCPSFEDICEGCSENEKQDVSLNNLPELCLEMDQSKVPLKQELGIDEEIPIKQEKKISKMAATSKRYREKQKEELEYLRKKMISLESELGTLQGRSGRKREETSSWENEARDQSMKRRKAEQDNLELKKSLESQMQFAAALKQMLAQKPNTEQLVSITLDQWKSNCLRSADSEVRLRDMHAIADREYERLSTTMLDTGLHDLTNQFEAIRFNKQEVKDALEVNTLATDVTKPGFELKAQLKPLIEMELLRNEIIDKATIESTAQVAWNVLRGKVQKEFANGGFFAEEVLSVANTLGYVRFYGQIPLADGSFSEVRDTLAVFKKYKEPHRTVIVWQSILEDVLYPPAKDFHRSSDSGCIVVSSDSTLYEERTIMKSVLRMRPHMGDFMNRPAGTVTESLFERFANGAKELIELIISTSHHSAATKEDSQSCVDICSTET